MTGCTICKLFSWVVLVILPWSIDAYRVGDAIDTEIWTTKHASSEEAPMRSQMALFGMDRAAKFPRTTDRFSISFEEGFRVLPWINMKNGAGHPLEKVEVTFVYSRSGGGEIHSLSSKPIYNKETPSNSEIVVVYKWIEEELVDLNSGAFVMFLAVFVVSVYFLFDFCGLCDTEDGAELYSLGATDGHYPAPRDIDPLAVMSGANVPKYE